MGRRWHRRLLATARTVGCRQRRPGRDRPAHDLLRMVGWACRPAARQAAGGDHIAGRRARAVDDPAKRRCPHPSALMRRPSVSAWRSSTKRSEFARKGTMTVRAVAIWPRPSEWRLRASGSKPSPRLAATGGGRRGVRYAVRCVALLCVIRTSEPPRVGLSYGLPGAAEDVSSSCSSFASSAAISPIPTRSSGLMKPSLMRKPPARTTASRIGTAQ
jgi:hypothetical protein